MYHSDFNGNEMMQYSRTVQVYGIIPPYHSCEGIGTVVDSTGYCVLHFS